MLDAGFDVTRGEELSWFLDKFPVYMPDRDSRGEILDYGGLVMSRARDGGIRNSFELSVALLATGVLVRSQAEGTNQDCDNISVTH